MNFEEYLIKKNIDSSAFKASEPELWKSWREEFEQIHPNSFTMQKLNLINPIRRKYILKEEVKNDLPAISSGIKTEPSATPSTKPVIAKPVIKPKPKID